jgi:hypothetical protein
MSKGLLLVACIVGDVKHDDSVECGVEADMKVPEKGGRLRRWKLEAKDSQPCPLPCVALLLTLILTLILHTRLLYVPQHSDSFCSSAVLIPLVYLAFLCAPPCHLRSSSVSERSPQTTQHILY